MFSMPRFLTRLIVVSNMVWKTINALVKEILLTLQLPYLNGPIEATNNHIKVLKRTAYGFRNFIHFKIRIFINRAKYFEKKKKSNIQKMNNKKTHKKARHC